jgi:glycerophosphodiester phosphodiesterase
MNVAALLTPKQPYVAPLVQPLRPSNNAPAIQPKASRFYGHNYLQGQSLVMITLGFSDTREPVAPVHLNYGHGASIADGFSALSLIVSAANATGERAIIDLPVKDYSEPILFYVDESAPNSGTDVVVQFDIVPTNSARRQVLARAISVVDGVAGKKATVNPRNAGKVEGRGGKVMVPLMSDKFETVGKICFEYTVVTPFSHPQMSIGSKQTYWKAVATQVNSIMNMNRSQIYLNNSYSISGYWTSRCWCKSCNIGKSSDW